jgi:hypothetical protein
MFPTIDFLALALALARVWCDGLLIRFFLVVSHSTLFFFPLF